MRFPAIGLAYLVLYATGASLLSGESAARGVFGTIGIILPALSMGAVVLYRRHEWQGCQRLFWDAAALGVGLWVVGYIGWAVDAIASGATGWLRWYTIVSLCGGIIPLIALLAKPHRGIRAGAVTGVALLMASYGLLAVFIYAGFLLVPSLVLPEPEAQSALLTLVQANRAALATGFLTIAWIGRRTAWRQTYLLLAAGVTIGFLLRLATARGIFQGRYESGTFFDLAWIVPFLCYAWSAWASPASSLKATTEEPSTPMLPAFWTAVPVLLIPVIGYLALWLQPLGATGDAFRALLTALMTVTGLGFLTLRLSLQAGELQRVDARLRLLAAATEQTQDMILITQSNGQVEHANDAFVRTLGYSRAELHRCSFAELLDKGFRDVDRRIREELRARGVWRGTLLRRRRDGSTFPAACTITALRDSGAITHLVGVERDITEELRLQDQLVHTERLSAIGELVAGVAHEINNPLQTVIGSVELMLEEPQAPSTRRDLETVRREAARAAQIVRSLLAFVRRGTPERVPLDVNHVVRDVIALREFQLQQKSIRLVSELSAEGLVVMGSREELQQIVMNLLLNAEQAAGEDGNGIITIRTAVGERLCTLEIADNGYGVPEDLRGRIFEPFFTTKPVGEGTGLGLSISHGIASAHGGTLEAIPAEVGAMFRLVLPIHDAVIAAEDPVSGPGEARPDRATTSRLPFALVIDDEPAIRMLVVRLLQKREFEVVEAGAGDEAMKVLRDKEFAVVLCDIRMPGMTGFELYERVSSELHVPVPPFIFMTGDRAAAERAGHSAEVLAKPFTVKDLDRALAAVQRPNQFSRE